MLWKEAQEGQAVAPYSLVQQVALNALTADPEASGSAIAKENLGLFQALYGEAEVSERGLVDQMRTAVKGSESLLENSGVNVIALATLHYGEVFTEEDVQLATWDNGTKNGELTAQVAARIYKRQRAPFNVMGIGALVVGKKAGNVFGFTRVTDVQYLTVESDSAEGFLADIQAAKEKLAAMAEDIPVDNKNLVLEPNDFWVPDAEFYTHVGEEATTYRAYVSLVTFAPWVTLDEVYAGAMPGTGMVKIDLALGKGPGASWYSGNGGLNNITKTLCSFNPTWAVPQKRGRKPLPETVAKREAVVLAALAAEAIAAESKASEEVIEVEEVIEEVEV